MLLNIVKKEIEKALQSSEMSTPFSNSGSDVNNDTKRDVDSFDVSYIEEEKFGHVTSNISMILARSSKQNPKDVAQSIVDAINSSSVFSKIEVAGPGFINFTFSDDYLAENFVQNDVESIIENIKSKNINNLNGRDVLVEYTDPNPFKVFHIGHLMTNIIGESLAGVYELAGAKVKRVNYQGDVGRHIAINISAILKTENKNIFQEMAADTEHKVKSLKQKVQWLGEKYAEGYSEFDGANSKEDKSDEDTKIINHVSNINKSIYEKSDTEIKDIYDIGRAWSLEYFEVLYKMLGTKFDKYIFESEAAPIGLDIVLKNIKSDNNTKENKNIFEIGEEGAIIFDGEKEISSNGKKLHKRVFVNKNGLPTYEAKDLGNMEIKLAYARENNLNIYKSVIVTANEVNDYFKVIESVIEKLRPELTGNLVHFGHGMMKFADGKMSSRKGNIIAGDELISDIGDKLKEKFSESRIVNEEEKSKLIEKVSVASIKYAVLRQAIGRDVVFDIDKVISVEGDSGPYLQYTHARLSAVAKDNDNLKININAENQNLILTISKYEDALVEVISENAPHKLVTYLTLLCREANSWYAHNRVVGNSDNELIASKAKEILAHGLSVLAMHAPKSM